MTETARGWLFGGTVGCVIIMGNVHAGHEALIRAARLRNEICVVCLLADSWSSQNSAVSTYSLCDIEKNLELLKRTGADAVFLPHRADLYPADFSTYVTPMTSWLGDSVAGRDATREAATLMLKLYHVMRPDFLYFEQQDARMIALLRQLVRDFHLDLEIAVLPTLREQNGLAITHANAFLSLEECAVAGLLYDTLLLGKGLIEQGERCSWVIEQAMREHLAADTQFFLQRLSICHADTFGSLQAIVPNTLLEIQAQLGSVSLTDNIVWMQDERWLL
jgi:pantoate--beta-alanine ligase